ncbi:hypothetical protein UFOVP1549_51 [uncultured Caudovirales phage]|uniref:Uncharacterized protein n=1 Tax=uncultured Caudovirales phage TaxID=2100421 RepID=A0A6J5LSW7_9CAUD|nr:hypothetical protein UFOVP303_43 [uncultured Caudovirales phage]CAB5228657.1 hypothetical protein UFOVP1549_51 [uncultured Caudovirales phage]
MLAKPHIPIGNLASVQASPHAPVMRLRIAHFFSVAHYGAIHNAKSIIKPRLATWRMAQGSMGGYAPIHNYFYKEVEPNCENFI